MFMWKVGWAREDGTFKSFMRVGASSEIEAREEAERQLNRPGRISIFVDWKKRGRQVQQD